MSEAAKPVVVKFNEARFREVDEVREENQDVELHNQPIYLTPNVKETLGITALGIGGIAGFGAGFGGNS